MVDDSGRTTIARRLFIPGLLLMGSIFVVLGVAEIILRVVPGILPTGVEQIISRSPANYGVAHSYIGHLHRPNTVRIMEHNDFRAIDHTDGYGFRNAWPWPDTAEIIAVGDSVTFGQGVDDGQAWPAILAGSFPASHIINLGLIGAGPQQYLRVYETFGLKLRPKVVLIGVFAANDFWDAAMFDSWLKSGAGGSYMVWRDFGRPMNASLSLNQPLGDLLKSLKWRVKLVLMRSYLFNLLMYVRGNFAGWLPSAKKIYKAPDGTRIELNPRHLFNNIKQAGPGFPVFDLVVDALQRINSLATEHGAKALVILQPNKEEVYLPLLGESSPDSVGPLRKALAERGVPYLDLLDDFRLHAAKGEVLFFQTDGHPNARGYALIAELVSSYLKQHAKEFGLQDALPMQG